MLKDEVRTLPPLVNQATFTTATKAAGKFPPHRYPSGLPNGEGDEWFKVTNCLTF